jgi:preprotein translocase SecE subunit
MARNRQRAKERKQRLKPGSDAGPLDDAVDGGVVDPVLGGGAPPVDLGQSPVPVEFADDDDADDDDGDDLERDDESAREVVGPGAGDVATPAVQRKGGLARVPAFLRACWAELQRVQWPDRRQVGQATAVVLGFVVIAGAFLGLADVVAQRIVDLIL